MGGVNVADKKILIHLERDSVCMGDDVTAPNAKDLRFDSGMRLSDLLPVVADNIPLRFDGQHTIWSIENDNRPVALLETDPAGHYTSELLMENSFLKDLEKKEIYCRYFYFYQGRLCSRLSNYIDGRPVDAHPECMTLSEKVKARYGLQEQH